MAVSASSWRWSHAPQRSFSSPFSGIPESWTNGCFLGFFFFQTSSHVITSNVRGVQKQEAVRYEYILRLPICRLVSSEMCLKLKSELYLLQSNLLGTLGWRLPRIMFSTLVTLARNILMVMNFLGGFRTTPISALYLYRKIDPRPLGPTKVVDK